MEIIKAEKILKALEKFILAENAKLNNFNDEKEEEFITNYIVARAEFANVCKESIVKSRELGYELVFRKE